MDACLQNYAQHRNSRLLPPALVGLTGQAALGMLPKLLDLEPAAFQAALHRLLMPLPSGTVAAYSLLYGCRDTCMPLFCQAGSLRGKPTLLGSLFT